MNPFNWFKRNEDTSGMKKKFYTAGSSSILSTAAAWTTFRGRAMFDEGFASNSWVYSCVRKRMTAAGTVPITVQKINGDGEWEGLNDHPLIRLLDAPNPSMSASELVETITSQLDIQGNFYAKITRGGRGGKMPLEIWPLPIGTVEPKMNGLEVSHYRFHPPGLGSVMDIDAEDMLHIRYTNPDGPVGLSPLMAGGKAVDIDNEAASFQKVSMQNRGVPDGVFSLDMDAEDDDVDAFEETRRRVKEQYANRQTAREPWVLSRVKFQQMSQSLADLDFMQGRKMTREEVCAVLDVPQPMVGIYDNATLSNIETARQIFWRDGMVPVLNGIQTALTNALASAFGRGIRVRFDLSTVRALQQSTDEITQTAERLWKMGVPLAEVNRRLEIGLDLNDVAGADQAMLPASTAPVAPESGAASGQGGGGNDVSLVTDVIEKVSAGQLPRDAAVRLLVNGVAWIDEQAARDMLEGV